ncbi:MAG: molybdopterin dinucleotide binding domain-containing protein [Aquificaceae bacterium]
MATTRRDFLRNVGLAGTGVGFLAFGSSALKDIVKGPFKPIPYANAAPLDMQDAERFKVVHSLCLGCNARCGFRARVYDGMVYKVDGNPYCMSNSYWEPLPMDTPLEESFKHTGKMCLKGQSIAHYVYDPYRIVTPLKRAGKRGEGKFKPISWDQLIKEVVEGGVIEETGEKLPGLKMYYDLYVSEEEVIEAVLNHVSKDFLNRWANAITKGKPVEDWKKFLEENIYKLWLPKEEAQKLPEDIKKKLIDPEMPALGPKSNFAVAIGGRVTEGRGEFVERLLYATIGSNNFLGHADVCQWPKWAGQIFAFDRPHVGPDLKSAQYVVAWGAQIAESFNPAIPTWTILHYRRGKGDLKVVWIDPRAHNGVVAYSHRHIMPKPGEDPAVACGIIRRIFEKKSFDRRFLENPNLEAAKEDGEVVFSNASHLVVVAPKDSPYYRKLLRASDLGLGSDKEYVVLDKATNSLKANTQSKSAYILMDEYEGAKEIPNELYEGEDIDPKRANKYPKKTKGLELKLKDGSTVYATTSLQLLKDFVFTETVEDWAKMAGVNPKDVIDTADELAFYGKRAAVVSYRGPVMHMNGSITQFLIDSINMLIGNIGHKGGMIWKVGTGETGKGRYDLGGGRKPWGLKLHRTLKNYEETAFYYKAKMEGKNPYPAKMPWFKFIGPKYHITGLFPSIAHNYPYDQNKAGVPYAVIQYMCDPLFTYPAQLHYKDILLDTKKIGLWIHVTTVIDDTSYFADYIVPDITYAEGFTGVHSLYHYFFFNAIRTAVIEPLTDKTPDGRPMQFETFCVDVGRRLGSPLWGEKAIKGMGPNEGKVFPLMRAEDFHLKQIANLVHDLESKGYKINPKKEDVEFVEKNYPIAKYKNAVSPEEWPKVAFLLSRGGFFISYEDHFENNLYKFPLNSTGMVRFYFEDLALRHNPITGKYMPGHPRYVSLREAGQYQGFDPDKIEQEYPFKLITYKPALHTQSRTINYIWALESEPENYLWINPVDAQRLGIKQGDYVKVLAPGYEDWAIDIGGKKVEFKIKAYVTNRIRQGVVAISTTFGHWCHSGTYRVPLEIQNPEKALLGLTRFKDLPEWRVKALHGTMKIVEGNRLLSDPKRDTGAPYIAMYPKITLPTGVVYPQMEWFGGGVAFYSGNVKVVKA